MKDDFLMKVKSVTSHKSLLMSKERKK